MARPGQRPLGILPLGTLIEPFEPLVSIVLKENWESNVSPLPGSERDSFDQWISWVLTASSEEAHPSEQVWQRIAGVVRASQALAIWRKRWTVSHSLTWSVWLEQRDQFVADTHLIGLGWWLFYVKPLPYS
jgi:hypothetical protein